MKTPHKHDKIDEKKPPQLKTAITGIGLQCAAGSHPIGLLSTVLDGVNPLPSQICRQPAFKLTCDVLLKNALTALQIFPPKELNPAKTLIHTLASSKPGQPNICVEQVNTETRAAYHTDIFCDDTKLQLDPRRRWQAIAIAL